MRVAAGEMTHAATGGPVRPRAFASTRSLTRAEMLSAPVRWPRPSRLSEPLQAGGRRVAEGLQSLGLLTVGDLLEHLPGDSRSARTVGALRAGEQATLTVSVRSISSRPVRRRGMRPLVQAVVGDGTGTVRATFFNQPWLLQRYPAGTILVLHGTADGRGGFRVSHHAPAAAGEEPAAAAEDAGAQAVAHYPSADGVTSTQILALVRAARPALADVPEALPGLARAAARMPTRAAALGAMHFPREPADLESGRRRLAFEELLLAQLVFLRRREARRALTGAHALTAEPALTARWLDGGLPFQPTGDQLRAIEEVRADLARTCPMQRLLMGEVGSGKTVVALYALLRAAEHRAQGALMAPTETLAEQHFATIQGLLGGESVSCALLTGSTPAARRRETLGRLQSGELLLVVGTHALIEPDVRFRELAVAVIDEQHRFGVRQRAALQEREQGAPAHTLHMTATPIPRTLALAGYGDLDTSTLRELPRGRQPIETRLVAGGRERERAYEELRGELDAGRQAYVVCPLIDQQEPAEGAETPRAAKEELRRLAAGELAGYELALLHGAMPAREKQEAMAAFAAGRAQVLVATTVIEVGIDVPNATVMLIENAERFGISQLHQLRGRVGRGEHASRCYLAGPAEAARSRRLRALAEHSDGFRLAEIDLALRKEGELLGTRQSGLGDLEVARLPEDAALLERARALAEAIAAADPELAGPEHELLGAALRARFGEQAQLAIPG